MEQFTEKQIAYGYCDYVLNKKAGNKIIPNIFLGMFEADILEITKSGYVYEYEIKTSVSDFKNDCKKSYEQRDYIDGKYGKKVILKKDELIHGNRVNYFYYVVPPMLINYEDVPEYAGLIYARFIDIRYYSKEKGYYDKSEMEFRVIKPAPKLKKDKISPEQYLLCLESCYHRFHALRK